MKKIFFGFLGLLFVVSAADADPVKAATTNTVRKDVYDIKYGSAAQADLDTHGYRKGVIPQGNELSDITGNTNVDTDSVSVGNLAAKDANNKPVETVTANTANIAVLDRDKLSVAGDVTGDGKCVSGVKCGYVTVGSGNNTTDKVWLKMSKCREENGKISCEK